MADSESRRNLRTAALVADLEAKPVQLDLLSFEKIVQNVRHPASIFEVATAAVNAVGGQALLGPVAYAPDVLTQVRELFALVGHGAQLLISFLLLQLRKRKERKEKSSKAASCTSFCFSHTGQRTLACATR